MKGLDPVPETPEQKYAKEQMFEIMSMQHYDPDEAIERFKGLRWWFIIMCSVSDYGYLREIAEWLIFLDWVLTE